VVKNKNMAANIILSLWRRGLPEKALKKFPSFYGTRRFITTFTRLPPALVLRQIDCLPVYYPKM
jgi:hypothetical protein